MSFEIEPVGYVHASRTSADDDYWGASQSEIRLVENYGSETLAGLEEFSHVEILFVLDRVDPSEIVSTRHPRYNENWPRVGVFAERGSRRPNRLGSTICRIISVSGRVLRVQELDAIHQTPVIDIKPVLAESCRGVSYGNPHGRVNSWLTTGAKATPDLQASRS